MGELLSTILRELKQATGATKALAGIVAACVVAMIGVAAVVSNKPDLQPGFSELTAAEMSAVSKALSDSGIVFEVSSPPGPYVVFVDAGERSEAMAAAYGSGALDKPVGGIMSDTGAASLFLGNEERRQAVRKREWQETEGMLQTLDFILSAKVRTSPGDPRPLLGRPSAPTTASVTLRLVGSKPMADDQFDVVARLVSRGLGILPQNIVISDQAGMFYDGSSMQDDSVVLGNQLSHKQDYDARTAETVNSMLEAVLGSDKAYVMIDSLWDFDQSVTRTETSTEGAPVSEDSISTSQPITGSMGAGGVAGITSNIASGDGFGVENSAVPTSTGDQKPLLATSEEKRTEYAPTRSFSERVRNAPELKRLSVALYVDESIDDAGLERLKRIVSASVHFNELRQDTISAERFAFPTPEVIEDESVPTGEEEESSGPNPMIEMLLTRGVEILSALVFLVFLLKSLKSARSVAEDTEAPVMIQRVAADGTVSEIPVSKNAEIDPEMMARMQIEHLLDSDPEKVGDILSSWARGEDVEAGAAA